MLEVWVGSRLCISNIFMGDTDALGTTVDNHFLFSRGSLIKQEKIKSLCWVIVDVSYLKPVRLDWSNELHDYETNLAGKGKRE